MIESYKKLLDILKSQTKKIVLITIPPIIKETEPVLHWKTFKKFNKYILEQHDGILT